jgi:hypothetical protein
MLEHYLKVCHDRFLSHLSVFIYSHTPIRRYITYAVQKALFNKGRKKQLTHSIVAFFEQLVFIRLVTKLPVFIVLTLFHDHSLSRID